MAGGEGTSVRAICSARDLSPWLNASKSRSSRFRNRPLGKTSAVIPEKLAVCVKRHPFVVGSIRKECLPLKTHPKTSFRSQVSSLPVRSWVSFERKRRPRQPLSSSTVSVAPNASSPRMFENRAFHSGYRSKSHRISQITEAGAKISIEVLTWTGITEQQHTHTQCRVCCSFRFVSPETVHWEGASDAPRLRVVVRLQARRHHYLRL